MHVRQFAKVKLKNIFNETNLHCDIAHPQDFESGQKSLKTNESCGKKLVKECGPTIKALFAHGQRVKHWFHMQMISWFLKGEFLDHTHQHAKTTKTGVLCKSDKPHCQVLDLRNLQSTTNVVSGPIVMMDSFASSKCDNQSSARWFHSLME